MTKKPLAGVPARAAELQPRLAQAADRLNDKIAAFEAALVSLNLGVAASVILYDEDSFPSGTNLEFRKHVGKWRLLVFKWDDAHDVSERSPLVGASREVRLDAAELFPKLLDALIEASEQELSRLDASAAAVDSLISTMNVGTK